MKHIKKVLSFIVDLIEIYLPMTTFALLFVVFIIQIFFRYVLNNPLTWPYEVTILAYIWTAMFGGCYAFRKLEHIEFTMVYDRLNTKGQLIFRLISHTILAVCFCIALIPIFNYIVFLSIKFTGVLKIPFNIGYLPFLIMSVDIIIRTVVFLVKDVRNLIKREYEGGEC